MSSKIQILPDKVANQIAAGEVVERPASVVKELVENSLDADANEIFVEIEKGGRKLIKVSDNGCGMSRDDAFLCLERHATSKIKSSQDLFALNTMGFRGEALPSIASVTRFRLTTRAVDNEVGWQLYAEGGVVRHAAAIGAPPGTTVEVRDLFFNTPGRRKFLRKEETEFGHISDVLTRIALARPDIHFRLKNNGRTYLETFRHQSLSERVLTLLGRSLMGDLLPIDVDSEQGIVLHGLLGMPGLNRSNTNQLYTYVNGRFVRDRMFQHAILEAYRSLLEKRRYPVGILFLDLPTDQVDVNVHPTKHEVRFREQRHVHDFITLTLRQQLQKVNPVQGKRFGDSSLKSNSTAQITKTSMNSPPPDPSTSVRSLQHEFSLDRVPQQERIEKSLQSYATRENFVNRPSRGSSVKGEALSLRDEHESKPVLPEGWRLIGQYLNSYLICQAGEDLVLIDQHAAHERIGFERLRRQFQSGRIISQTLLFPQVLEFDHRDAVIIEEHLNEFLRFGFEIDAFSGRSFSIKAIPEILSSNDVERLIRDVAAELNDFGRTDQVDQAFEKVLMVMACHGMVRAGQALTLAEMDALIIELANIDFGSCCPHGRPVIRRLKRSEVEKFFHRL